MRHFHRAFLTGLAIALASTTSGCTAFKSFSEVETLNNTKATGTPFTQALAAEYRAYANSELKDMFDYPDALHFARKGLAAVAGEAVLPEPVADWNLDESHIPELSASRGRLIVAYDMRARETAPALAAKVQAKFDCWIEGQEENWNDSKNMACKDEFLKNIAELEGQLQPGPVAVKTGPQGAFDIDASQPMASENAMYLVFFDWDKANLTEAAMGILDAVAQEIQKNPPKAVNVVGHADTSGPSDYNQRLAMKRANATKNALVKRGVKAAMIHVDAKGETELMIPTPDNVREPANRRANISFE